MSVAVRVLAFGWLVAGVMLILVGVNELFDGRIVQLGRVMIVPLFPLITLAGAAASCAQAFGLWFGCSYVALLGRLLSVPLFGAAIWLLIATVLQFPLNGLDRPLLVDAAVGVLLLGISALNYRIAQQTQD